MSKEKLIPNLRFPEFKNEGEWNSTPLDDLCELITKGTTPTTLGFSYSDSGINFIKIESILEGNINLEKAAFISIECNEALKRSQLKEDDILFSIAGALGVVTTVTKKILPANTNQALSIVRLKNKRQKDYIKAFLKTNHITAEVQKIKAGAAQPNISLDQVANFSILLPKNTQEQQKIASCLSSLDEVIAGHSQKLALLKDHKKGLMQNLFPQEGEKVPKYRFKEFEKDGEWVEKTFEQLFIIGNGRDYKHLDKGKIPVYGSGGYMLSVNECLYDGESVCIGRKGTIDKPMFLTGKFWTVDTLFYTYSFKQCLPKYIFYVFENINWRNHNEAGGVPSLSKTNIYKIQVLVPPTIQEQQKIASCLSSLDALITAEAEKIEQLKLHKKGLMQGLFPKINEI
jgi:type I restriction enzyme S subunit